MIQDICAYLALGQGDHVRRHFLRVMNRPVRYMKRDSLPETKIEREAVIRYYAAAPLIQARVKNFSVRLIVWRENGCICRFITYGR